MEKIELRKENRFECLFCSSYELCRRLEVNERIIRDIEEGGKCPDRIPIWINPSTRFRFFLFINSVTIIGKEEPYDLNIYFRPFLSEVKKYVQEL